MSNKRLLFIGSSLTRQQVKALAWTLGHKKIKWKTHSAWTTWPWSGKKKCTTSRKCFVDAESNITICDQFIGVLGTKIYREGNYTLDVSARGHGDSSCILAPDDTRMKKMSPFDFHVVFVQSTVWWTNLGSRLDSPASPESWVTGMLPAVYYDSMKALLEMLASRSRTDTKVVFVLGHTGTDCAFKTEPEPFSVEAIPPTYNWGLTGKLWDASLDLIRGEGRLGSDVQIVDARDPLMQSVHAHRNSMEDGDRMDCLHFCMNSAAVNMYLDIYWNEVFSVAGDDGVVVEAHDR